MRTLILGGTHHVGRAFVEAALARGDEVTTLNRGQSREPASGVQALTADRTDADSMARALDSGAEWDLVFDTWSREPSAVATSAGLLSGRVPYYAYVSSRSVFSWPIPNGADESAPVVDADPASDDGSDYAAAKRGGELAVEQGFDGDVALLRAGMILGPYEVIGRLPFWLSRIARGGRVPAPGPQDRPLQYVDCRDLADWVLRDRPVGVFNTVSQPGHATIADVLDACVTAIGADAELEWLTPEEIETAGVAPWTEIPIWVPPTGELAALHDGDVSAAYAAGLVCRPIAETVADTWAWIQREGMPSAEMQRAGTGLTPDAEARLWAAHGS